MPRPMPVALFSLASLLLTPVSSPALAADAAPTAQPFDLGEITVYGQRQQSRLQLLPQMSGSTLPAEDMWKFSRNSLDDAVNLIPGVSASNTGGSRNERVINVRGFDRFQVPLLIDGIRVYLPADNRLDFGRFLTPDIAEIQVAKGYVSLLDGPGGMGGAINLVTVKPTRPFEGEMRAGLSLDRDLDYGGHTQFGRVGARHDEFYLQASGAWNKRDHFTLSSHFDPTPSENGGKRAFSNSDDWRINFKAGYTPNDTDEYSISYTDQEGAKSAPASTTDPISSQRYWDWPYWDISSLYFLSTTQLDASHAVTLKTRIYYNTFDNGLYSYDDFGRTMQTLGRSFRSYYDDDAYGGSAELSADPVSSDTLQAAFHYRRDEHVEWQDSYAPVPSTEPKQHTREDTYSLALENTFHPIEQVDLVAGVSYDWRDLIHAEDYSGGAFVYYPLADSHAWNWQGAVIYRPDATSRLYANISSRTRFPTIFERFSSRFGGATSNPDLKSERGLNLEAGGAHDFGPGIHAETAIFYSDIDDLIQSVPIVFQDQNVTQSQNVGSGRFWGAELSLKADVAPGLSLGGNYTYTHRHVHNPGDPDFRPTDVPTHKAFVYADYDVAPRVTVSPSLDIASDRWTARSDGSLYYRTGAYALANLRVAYRVGDVELAAGVRNLFDANYQLTDGFPEEGRNFFLNTRLIF